MTPQKTKSETLTTRQAKDHLVIRELSAELIRIKAQRDELGQILQQWQDWSEGKTSWPKLSTNVALKTLQREA